MSVPTSTYRLQISDQFDLDDAAALTDYLHDLGADWVYLSPLLTANPGSTHGYDVVDHTAVDPVRGGPDGLRRLSERSRELGMGILVDIVPNHVGVATPAANRWWWDVLAHGQASPHAEAFDIDWDAGDGKIRIPILGDEPDPELTIVDGELHYHEHHFPLAPGTDTTDDLPEVLSRQHYALVNWREADSGLNYRRFFAVNSLAGLRVEVPGVFAESHREIRRWVQDGLVDGLRVDHPDGLARPGAYFDDLRSHTGVGYVLAEKILEGPERLPPTWNVEGTTGYDALADIDRLFVDPDGGDVLASSVDWHELIHDTKRAVTDGILRSEVLRLGRDVARSRIAPRGIEAARIADAIAELLTCFPVYRSYLPEGSEHLRAAAFAAADHRPDLADVIAALLPLLGDPDEPAAIRFQQTSGMVMAKGVEDCAFYRYNRLGTLTEVGGDPSEFGIDPTEFHERQRRRLESSPLSMTTLTTHDTKRSEDTRARISVLAEIPDEWLTASNELRRLSPLVDRQVAELVWQAAIGAWPISRARLSAYALKAAREAATSTSWSSPDEQFEQALERMVGDAFDHPGVAAQLDRIVQIVRRPGWSNSLSAKLIQLTIPGVPDVYQGTELWDSSLVDPDNRRPVDFAHRRQLLQSVRRTLPAVDESGAAKMLLTTSALRARRDRPDLFTSYTPLGATGPRAAHAVAFDRGGAITVATRLPISLQRGGGWGSTELDVGRRRMRDALTGRTFEPGPQLVASILHAYPAALLLPAPDGVA